MPITSHIDHAKDLASFTATGNITPDEVIAMVQMFYDQPTKNVLWDLTAASELNFQSDELRKIASYPQRVESTFRINGKTAIAAPQDLTYGLSRMFQSFSEFNSVPFEVMTFRTMEEAEDWLEV
jgi:hypothetical protein